MNAVEFYNKFLQATNENRVFDGKKLIDIYKSDKQFTPVVTKIINEIIDAAGPDYRHQNEYFRIDAVGWVSRYEDMKADAEEKNLKISAHLWNLKIAVEHENSKADWTDELMKLIHIKCPLKVIISYSHIDERGSIEQEKLDFAAKWMQKIDALQKGTDEEYLIILGNGDHHKTGKSDYETFDYIGYIYDRKKKSFVRI